MCALPWLVFGVVRPLVGVVLEAGCTSAEELEHAVARMASSMSIKATQFLADFLVAFI
jgi:hypothetical protein